jgi:hypothetical protein
MDWKFKKICPAVSATLIALTSVLSANNDQDQMPEQTIGSNDMNAPSSRPQLKDPSHWVLGVDLLVWKAHADGLVPAIENNNLASGTSTNASNFYNADFEHLHFKWNTGFRLTAGYNLAHDMWDILFDWTHFNAKASLNEEADPDVAPVQTLYPLWSAYNQNAATISAPTILEVDAKWKLHLNMIDGEIGRRFFAGKWLSVRPNIGLRAAWVRQTFDIDYYGGTFSTAGIEDIDMKNNFWGIGPRIGINTQWALGCGFSLYGDGALSLLYGRFKISQEEFIGPEELVNPASNTVINIQDNYHVTKAVTDMTLGVRWETGFRDSGCHFTLSAGWENHIFFNQNQLKRFWTIDNATATGTGWTQFTNDNGDLTTQGFTLSARFDF